MKNLFLISVLLFLSINLKSQSYIPMIEDSMIVVNGYNGYDFPEPIVYKYLGDTTINSRNYFKVYHSSTLNDSSFTINSNLSYYGAIREVNKRVYFLKKDSVLERKIYDFNLNVNDTTLIYYTSRYLNTNVEVTLNKIDSVSTFYGRNIYEHSHNKSTFFNHYYLVEGFGVIHYSSNEIESDYGTKKLCVIKKNNPQHNIPANYSTCYRQIKNSFISINEIKRNNVEVYPNPAVNKITIQSNDTELQSVSIYDINGKLINHISGKKNKNVIDVTSFEPAVYTLQIVTEKGIVTKNFVKN